MKTKKTSKTTFTIIMLVLVGIAILQGISSIFTSIISTVLFLLGTVPSTTLSFSMATALIALIYTPIMIIYFLKLYRVKKDVISWTHIAFSAAIIKSITEVLITSFLIAQDSFTNAGAFFIAAGSTFAFVIITVGTIVRVTLWITFVNHLKKAKKEKMMSFS